MKLCIERGCFIIISNVFRWCVTLGNRVHNISIETELMNGFHISAGSLIYHVNSDCMLVLHQFSYFWLLRNHLLTSTEVRFWNLQIFYNKNMRLTSQVFTTKIWYSFDILKFATASSINSDNFHLLVLALTPPTQTRRVFSNLDAHALQQSHKWLPNLGCYPLHPNLAFFKLN
jgi:hypothetical protein